MGLSLLAPLFLAGLVALAAPILVHLTARARRDVLRFPSLKFLTRLPYRQARRQRLRHKLLFALRALAVILLVLAFSRPLVGGAPPVTLDGGGREVVIALDRSYSMGYRGTWERAVAAARDAVSRLPAGSRASLVGFDRDAEVAVLPGETRAVLEALDRLAPGSGGTRFAPALRLAEEILLDSPLAEREVVLVSDLQAAGWDRSADADPAVLAPGIGLTAVGSLLAAGDVANVQIASAETRQTRRDAGPRLTVGARLVNRGTVAVEGLPVTVTAEPAAADGGRARVRADLPPARAATASLGPIELPPGVARVTIRVGEDALPADDVFHLTVAPRDAVPVLLIEAPDAQGSSLYLREALAVASGEAEADAAQPPPAPAFELRARRAGEVTAADIGAASVVVLHDSPFPSGAAGSALAERVAAGGGLWVLLGSRSAPPGPELAELLPGSWRDTVDRLEGRGVGLAGVDYRHPVFEIFAGPGDGNLAAPRFYRYRPIEVGEDPPEPVTVLARTTDGAVALAERRVGEGRVLVWGSTFDNRWSDLPVQAVFLPFVHQVCRYLAGARAFEPWVRVGQALDLRAWAAAAGVDDPGATAIVTAPSGARRQIAFDAAPSGAGTGALILEQAGFYEVTLPDRGITLPVAVNVDPAEADLTPLDAEAFVAASTAAASKPEAAAAAGKAPTRAQRERRQGIWWYLLLAALLLLAAESLGSNLLAGVGGRNPDSRARV